MIRILALSIALLSSLPVQAQILRAAQGIQVFDGAGGANPAKVSPVNQARIRYNLSLSRLEQSLNGGAYAAFGGGGGAATLPALYVLGASQTDSTFLLDATRLGLRIRDNATPTAGALFAVQSAAGAKTFFDVTASGLDVSQAVQTSGAAPFNVFVTPAAHTGLTAASELHDLYIQGRTVQWAAGALATQRFVRLAQNTISFVGASTVTNAATLATEGPPIQGTNATLTNTYDVFLGGGKLGSTATILAQTTVASGASRNGFVVNDVNAASATDVMFAVQLAGTNRLVFRQDRFLGNLTAICGFYLLDAGTVQLWANGINVATVNTANISSTTDFQTALGTSSLRYSNVWARQHNGAQPADLANAASVTITVGNGETQRALAGATAMVINGSAGNPGEKIVVCVVEDATGTRTASFATGSNNFKLAGGAYTLTATVNKKDCFSFAWDTADTTWAETGRALNL